MRRGKYAEQLRTQAVLQLFSRFFLADVAFTFLLLAVVAVLRLSLGTFNSSFFSDPEWAFAAIIVYGLAMTRALELKVLYQKDSSERVFGLMRMCILGLIAAVLSLALTQMSLAGLLVSSKVMLTFQFAVLGLGIFTLYVTHSAREQFIQEKEHLPNDIALPGFFRFILDDLQSLRNDADKLSVRMSKRNAPQSRKQCGRRRKREPILWQRLEHRRPRAIPPFKRLKWRRSRGTAAFRSCDFR